MKRKEDFYPVFYPQKQILNVQHPISSKITQEKADTSCLSDRWGAILYLQCIYEMATYICSCKNTEKKEYKISSKFAIVHVFS